MILLRWFAIAYVGLFVWGFVFIGTVFLSIEIMNLMGMGSWTGNSWHLAKESDGMFPQILLANAVVSGILICLAGALFSRAKKQAALRKARQEAELEINDVGF